MLPMIWLMGSSQSLAQETPRPLSLSLPTVVFAGAAASDWTTTYHGISQGYFEEGNVLIKRWQEHPAVMVAAGAAMDVAGVLVWNRFVGRSHPKIASVGLYAMSGFRIYLAFKGVTMIKAANRGSASIPR